MRHSLELNESINQTIEKHSASIIRIVFAYVKNIHDAEDIAQDVFLSLLIENPTFDSDTHEKAWLFKVAINKSKNHVRTVWFRKRDQIPEDLSYLPAEENTVLNEVMNLEKKYRIPVHLFYYEGYSIQEIADLLKAKPATVGTWLARGRAILKKRIGDFSDE